MVYDTLSYLSLLLSGVSHENTCRIATSYKSVRTDEVIGVTMVGTGFIAIRDASYLFSIQPHKDAGNWTVAMGVVSGHALTMVEGFQDTASLWPYESPSMPAGVPFCRIEWPRATDHWVPWVLSDGRPRLAPQYDRLGLREYFAARSAWAQRPSQVNFDVIQNEIDDLFEWAERTFANSDPADEEEDEWDYSYEEEEGEYDTETESDPKWWAQEESESGLFSWWPYWLGGTSSPPPPPQDLSPPSPPMPPPDIPESDFEYYVSPGPFRPPVAPPSLSPE